MFRPGRWNPDKVNTEHLRADLVNISCVDQFRGRLLCGLHAERAGSEGGGDSDQVGEKYLDMTRSPQFCFDCLFVCLLACLLAPLFFPSPPPTLSWVL